jgi:hypothetical protein
MGLKSNFNPGQLEFNLRQIGERAMVGMSGRMRKAAIKIRDLAREFAPVLTGDLESAIDYAAVRDGRRNSYVVYVDLDKVHGGDKTVGDYAFIMEEQLRPYGNRGKALHLGRLSQSKAAGGKKVGGRFLSRAIKEGTTELVNELAEEVRRVTRSSSGRTIPMTHGGRQTSDE